MKYFIKPPADVFLSADSTYCQGYKTYSEYNYLRPGISSYIKSWHFEMALDLTKGYFHKANVIDFGCADGIFIPSLSKYFNHVCAIDQKPSFVKTASGLVKALNLGNVELLCNDGLTIRNARQRLSNVEYHVLYLLETLEHVGDKYSLYDSKIYFLKEIASLISKEGVLVVSVPIMIGLPFLIQRLGLALTGSQWEPISLGNFLKASIFMNTTNLERQWNSGHLGFNHRKLENMMKNEFRILKKRNLLFQVVYLIGKK